jgi:hypothetical protein
MIDSSPPEQPEESAGSKDTASWWGAVKESIALIIAFLALVVSSLTFWSAHQASVSAARANQAAELDQYAVNVSYSLIGVGDGQQLIVRNPSNQPITSVMIEVTSVSSEPQADEGTPAVVGLGSVPACSEITADALNVARLYIIGYGPGPDDITGYPPFASDKVINSISAARHAVQRLEASNGFPVDTGPLVFTDVNGRQWSRYNGRTSQVAVPSKSFVGYVGNSPVHDVIKSIGCP